MLMFLSLKCWTKSLWFDRNLSLLMDYIYLSIVNNPWNLCWGNFLSNGESLKRQEFFIDFKTILWHCRDLMFYADDTRINTALYNEHSECSMMLKFQVRDSGVNGWFFFSLSPFSCNFLLFFYRLFLRRWINLVVKHVMVFFLHN